MLYEFRNNSNLKQKYICNNLANHHHIIIKHGLTHCDLYSEYLVLAIGFDYLKSECLHTRVARKWLWLVFDHC